MPAICPVCGKDDAIQLVSAVVASGQATGTFSGPSGGVAYVGGKWGSVNGYTTLRGGTTSQLAQLLAPPPFAEETRRLWMLVGGIPYLSWGAGYTRFRRNHDDTLG